MSRMIYGHTPPFQTDDPLEPDSWQPPKGSLKELLTRKIEEMNSLDKQISGKHYVDKAIQPIVYIHANKLDFFEGCVVKYISRHKEKNGAEDIKKAIHYLEMILDMQYGEKK